MPQELILTFHGVGEPPHAISDAERMVWVPVEWLAAIVEAMAPRGVALAFDDGNASDVEQALPILVRGGTTARFFPLAGRIGTAAHLGERDISKLIAAGMRVGSHGVGHRDWRGLEDDELREELTASRRRLAGIVGADITEAACPFGSYDRRVLRALHAAGYRRVFNSDGGPGWVNSWPTPRTTIHRGRPLEHWLELAARGPRRTVGPTLLGKRLIKRLR